jgi:hypothetical protein
VALRGLQRSIARTDPAGRGPPARVRKPIPPAAAFAHQQRHVFTSLLLMICNSEKAAMALSEKAPKLVALSA